jgi:hypothetical protein
MAYINQQPEFIKVQNDHTFKRRYRWRSSYLSQEDVAVFKDVTNWLRSQSK